MDKLLVSAKVMQICLGQFSRIKLGHANLIWTNFSYQPGSCKSALNNFPVLSLCHANLNWTIFSYQSRSCKSDMDSSRISLGHANLIWIIFPYQSESCKSDMDKLLVSARVMQICLGQFSRIKPGSYKSDMDSSRIKLGHANLIWTYFPYKPGSCKSDMDNFPVSVLVIQISRITFQANVFTWAL
ncbi:hypothetical protein CEXT_60451 [Caerostris extrusa]|uniref:Uncharacterized protein n=1 Tax=Caerostris extrusa TaxID=172846 RepID=A0AAV4W4G1_CAEEX|nr:hypothetical protein CEXT_60451 [Caerostris extrusa]